MNKKEEDEKKKPNHEMHGRHGTEEDCLRIGNRSIMAGMKLRGVVMCLCFVGLAAGSASAQPILLYEKGKLDEMKGMRRVLITAQSETDRAAIAKQINGRHGLRVVRNAASAQALVFYVCGMPAQPPAIAHLTVTIPRGDRMINVWSKKGTTESCRSAAARTSLVKEFLMEFAEMNRKKLSTWNSDNARSRSAL